MPDGAKIQVVENAKTVRSVAYSNSLAGEQRATVRQDCQTVA